MATVDSLLPRVFVHASGVPGNFARQALVEAAREFCRETRYWREDLTAIDTVANQSVYAPTYPAESELVDFVDVYYSTKRRLLPKTVRQLDSINSQWRTNKGEPYYYIRSGTGSLQLVYVPQEAIVGGLQISAALQPTAAATTIDDKILNDWDEYIIYGALHRVLRVPGKAWTNEKMSAFYGGMFQAGIDKASARGADERSKGVRRKVKYGGL